MCIPHFWLRGTICRNPGTQARRRPSLRVRVKSCPDGACETTITTGPAHGLTALSAQPATPNPFSRDAACLLCPVRENVCLLKIDQASGMQRLHHPVLICSRTRSRRPRSELERTSLVSIKSADKGSKGKGMHAVSGFGGFRPSTVVVSTYPPLAMQPPVLITHLRAPSRTFLAPWEG